MKKYLLVALVVLMLLAVGCSKEATVGEAMKTPAQQPTTTPPVTTGAAEKAGIEPSPFKAAEEEKAASTVRTVDVLGKTGFSSKDLVIKKGESVTFVNKDLSETDRWKNVVLVFQNQKDRTSVNSPQIAYGKDYTYTFNEAGTYVFWTVSYGVKGTIVVE